MNFIKQTHSPVPEKHIGVTGEFAVGSVEVASGQALS